MTAEIYAFIGDSDGADTRDTDSKVEDAFNNDEDRIDEDHEEGKTEGADNNAQFGASESDSEEQSSEADTEEVLATPVGDDQIPEKYKSKVTALQYASPGTLSLMTVKVKVGEYVTPMAASTWPDVVIYSQNTAVAVGEGILVKGVAKGETYVFVESMGMSGEAYLVIVE